MATLELSLNSLDGYSSKLEKIIRKTYQVTDKIFKANAQTDKINNKFEASGASAGKASIGFNKLFKSLASIENIKKGMDIIDEFTNTSTSLALINDGLQTQTELQNKVFAAADRSRGSYTDMANSVYNMANLAGDSFGSNDELIAFAELVQKSFKAGAAGAAEQSSAMQKLTQAMSDGSLQGDEFLYIMENAPLMADAIAKFTGKSKSELEKMAAEGAITSDIIKNAMFMASDDINNKFETMPMTFADLWNKIENHLLQNFGFIIQAAAEAAQFIGDNWDDIVPILYGAAAGVFAYALGLGILKIAEIEATIADKGLKATLMSNPLMLVALGIGLVVAAIAKWVQSVGGIDIAWQIVVNKILTGLDCLAIGYMLFVSTVDNFIEGMKVDFLTTTQELVNGGIDLINEFIKAANKILGTSFDTIDNVTFGATAQIEYEANKSARLEELENARYDAKMNKFMRQWEIDIAKENAVDKAADINSGFNFSAPSSVVGTGSNISGINVNMDNEDLQYLRNIAERDYINQFSTATLAPSIQMTFGDIHEEADANKVAGSIKRILQEEIATAAEGVYS